MTNMVYEQVTEIRTADEKTANELLASKEWQILKVAQTAGYKVLSKEVVPTSEIVFVMGRIKTVNAVPSSPSPAPVEKPRPATPQSRSLHRGVFYKRRSQP
jgi:hypothetical protein